MKFEIYLIKNRVNFELTSGKNWNNLRKTDQNLSQIWINFECNWVKLELILN